LGHGRGSRDGQKQEGTQKGHGHYFRQWLVEKPKISLDGAASLRP
jgi:hypothetical protein